MIVLSGGWYVPPGRPEIAVLRRSVEMPNPAAAKHSRLVESGRVSPYAYKPAATVGAWQPFPGDHPWVGGTILPRGIDTPGEYEDRRTDGEPIEAGLRVELRPYQRRAVDALLCERQGLVVAPCGAGKTTIGVGALVEVGRTALVLVHTLDLARQWRDRLAEQAGVEAGLVGDSVDERAAPVVVATVQTLARWPWTALQLWGRRFGLTVLDEAHHAPAETFCSVLGALPSRWRLGLTATPDRDDGLGPMLGWCFGRRLSEVRLADLALSGDVLLPELRVVRTGWKPEDEDESWAALMGALTKDQDRNALIVEEVLDLAMEGRVVLVLSERVAHCRVLAAALTASGVAAEPLVGVLTAKRRADLLARVRAGTLRVLVGTTVADEGLDLPNLDAVVMATGTRALSRVQQRIGRSMRPAPGKARPVVVDLVDAWGPLLGQAARRRSLYRSMGVVGA